jgi:bifunctional N-acetylglucosamine-1-phosphate-uridyltransferase/glucosamine-1-phosphate-acetyltransferase GlmU-like protein
LKKISKKLKDFSSEVKKELALQKKINSRWLKKGVRIQNPETVNICSETILEPGVVIEKNCTILQSVVRAGTLIKQGSRIEKSIIAQDCVLGPYAYVVNNCLYADRNDKRHSAKAEPVYQNNQNHRLI